ncbi:MULTISPECIES: patatin-like phospholipase family protein [Paenibacillus]|jgi:NTE family protein|uniref:patatin-like phospholipase family protein n=1 Tax=Paenibacillus TaxID=44249 RepID=UPI00073F34D4|nr:MULTISPECIES: patatin-like phospholipase family protein [Paenibacillus]MDU4695208.1 patatin-like phospholipase family protein [Paenibacillus sp.]
MLVNGVFEGGGVKGISLAGAVRAAEKYGARFHRVAGTSSGSIIASMIAAGYSADEMKDLIMTTSFSKFLKRAPIFNLALVGPALRILFKKGLYAGEALEEWVRQILLAKGIRTFGDLTPGKLTIIASDITSGKIMVLPDDLDKIGINPATFEVARAVRMSCSIPYFFDPVLLRLPPKLAKGKPFAEQFLHIVDGGLLSNFPLWLFDREEPRQGERRVPTVGFQMVGKNTNKPHGITGPFSMLQAIVETMLSAHDERYIEQSNRYRTVKIPTLGIGTTQFDISDEESLLLFESGFLAGDRFFGSWNMQVYEDQFKKYQQSFVAQK